MYTKYAIIAASLLASISVRGSTVNWTSSPYPVSGPMGNELTTGIFNTFGTLFLAENLGGSDTTFDGINFTAGSFTFSGGTSLDYHRADKSSELSHSGTYGIAGRPSTVSLTGLTVGDTYRVQALVYDGRNTPGISERRVSFDAADQGRYANGVHDVRWGDGLLVTGVFIADSVIQNFTIETFDGSISRGGHLNALLVHNTSRVNKRNSQSLLSIGGITLSLQQTK